MIVPLLLYSLVTIPIARAASPAPIVFLIQSQPGVFHERIAERTKTSILSQWKKYVPKHVMDPPKIILTAEVEVNQFEMNLLHQKDCCSQILSLSYLYSLIHCSTEFSDNKIHIVFMNIISPNSSFNGLSLRVICLRPSFDFST